MSPLPEKLSNYNLDEANQHLPNGWKINRDFNEMERNLNRKRSAFYTTSLHKCSSIEDTHNREELKDLKNCTMLEKVWSIINKQSMDKDEPETWVFGYGSLIWLPKFAYESRKEGYVQGFARRFWQGNVTHRGKPGAPGCVATLIKDNDVEKTWGVAYLLKGTNQINKALSHLLCREVDKGGYDVQSMQFTTIPDGAVEALTFVATPDNDHYLGPSSVDELARMIVASRGQSGHNLEYLFNLTDSLRQLKYAVVDCHLSELEDACHRLLSIVLTGRPDNSEEMCKLIDHNDQYVLYCVSTRYHFLTKHIIN